MQFAINFILIPVIKIALIMAIVPGYVAVITLAERKVIAWMQVRLGPMRVGPWGILQMVADPIKLLLKEDIVPTGADKWIFMLAPVVCLIPAFIVLAVIPLGPTINIAPIHAFGRTITIPPITPYVTDINIGVLYVLSISSVGVLGIILGGWASNSKYPLLGALRSAAQMVSYELALGLSVVGVVLRAGSLRLRDIVDVQAAHGILSWNVFGGFQIVAFFIYLISAYAETNRAPFDLVEAESELTGGYHTEYSSMKFAMFFMAEYANMITVGCVATLLFFGGWTSPFGNLLPTPHWIVIQALLPVFWFVLKVFFFVFLYIWVRGTTPRFRYDQLMGFGWKFLVPLAIANIIVAALIYAPR